MPNTMPLTEESAPMRVPPLHSFAWADSWHWLRLLWPVLLVVVGGAVFFRAAVVASIESTPHPVLVYSIFGVCLVAVVAATMALQGYLFESKYARRWMGMTAPMRVHSLKTERQRSAFMPVYSLLAGQKNLLPGARQSAVSTELESSEIALAQKLEFPNFLGGALVGMGLIGTFVGLLGTLEDLSKVFSALVNSGSSAMSPTQMFTDMVIKLQAPMRGMGTAFVASLYGLLGSLIVTLMMVSVRKTAASSMHQVHMAVRQLGYGAQSVLSAPVVPDESTQQESVSQLKVLQTMVEDLSRQTLARQAQQELMAQQNAQIIQDMLAAGQATLAHQKKTEETLQQQLSELKDVFVQERQSQMAAVSGTRQEAYEVIRSVEQCLASFESSTQRLRTMLASYNAPPDQATPMQ